MGGPCTPWATLADAQAIPELADIDAVVLTDALTFSSEILYRLSGRQFPGVCTDVVRPCQRWYRSESASPPQWWRWVPSWGEYTSQPPGRRGGVEVAAEITLGVYPIREISEVRIDGAVLDPAAYRVDDRRWLKRIDGDVWPLQQRLDKDPLVDVDTFQVAVGWGQAPPRSGVLACTELGGEIAKSIAAPDRCRLPQRVQSLTSQGVTLALLDPMAFLEKGLTGLYLVDLFLTAVNPHKLQRRAQVISPDIPRPVRRTGVLPGS